MTPSGRPAPIQFIEGSSAAAGQPNYWPSSPSFDPNPIYDPRTIFDDGSILPRAAGVGAMGLPFDSVFGKGSDDEDAPAIQAKKLNVQGENVRLRLVAAQQKRLAEQATASGFSRTLPFLVVGAVVTIGAIVMVARSRRKSR